jgi:hypothetical protein
MNELAQVLDDREKVLWEGKPVFWPFLFGKVFSLGTVFLFFYALGVFLSSSTSEGFGGLVLLFLILLAWGGLFFYQVIAYHFTYYAITNKRAILQGGIIGRDYRFVEFDQITNAEVNVNLFDKLFGGSRGAGSILISTAGTFTSGKHGIIPTPYSLAHIPHPYEVFKFFKKVSHDVKTDINYPNQLRPKKNKGYNTELG